MENNNYDDLSYKLSDCLDALFNNYDALEKNLEALYTERKKTQKVKCKDLKKSYEDIVGMLPIIDSYKKSYDVTLDELRSVEQEEITLRHQLHDIEQQQTLLKQYPVLSLQQQTLLQEEVKQLLPPPRIEFQSPRIEFQQRVTLSQQQTLFCKLEEERLRQLAPECQQQDWFKKEVNLLNLQRKLLILEEERLRQERLNQLYLQERTLQQQAFELRQERSAKLGIVVKKKTKLKEKKEKLGWMIVDFSGVEKYEHTH